MDTLAAYGSSSSSDDDESENDHKPKEVSGTTKDDLASRTISMIQHERNKDIDEVVDNNSIRSKRTKFNTASVRDSGGDADNKRNEQTNPRYYVLPPPQLPTDFVGGNTVPWIKDYLSTRQNELLVQLQHQQQNHPKDEPAEDINTTIIELNLQTFMNDHHLLIRQNDQKQYQSLDSKQPNFRSYADYLRSQHDFYNPRPNATATTTTTTSATTSTKQTKNASNCNAQLESWENIMNFIRMEEQARIKQYQVQSGN